MGLIKEPEGVDFTINNNLTDADKIILRAQETYQSALREWVSKFYEE